MSGSTVFVVAYLNIALFVPWLVAVAVPSDEPRLDTDFVEEIERNSALWPTRELRDSLIYLSGIAVVSFFAILALRRSSGRKLRPSFVAFLFLLASTQLVLALSRLDVRLRSLNPGFYFEGFSSREISIAILIALTVIYAARSRPAVQAVVSGIFALLMLPVLMSQFQFPFNNLDSTNSQFVYNELLAVSAGRFPLIDFSAQYSSGLAYVVSLLRLVGLTDPLVMVGISITGLNLTVSASLIFIVLKLETGRVLRLFFVSTVVTSTVFTTTGNGSLVGYFQAMPLRAVVFSGVIGVTYVLSHLRWQRHAARIVGMSAPLFLLVNFEFGIAAFVALSLTVAYLEPKVFSRRKILLTLVSLCAPVLLLQLGLSIYRAHSDAICGSVCGTEFVFAFGGKGFFAVPMPDNGLHLVVLSTFGVGALVSIRLRREFDTSEGSSMALVPLLMFTTSVYGLLGFQYFVGRSYAANLPTLFLPWTVTLVTMTIAVKRSKTIPSLLRPLLSIVLMTGCGLVLLHRPPLVTTASNMISPGPSTDFAALTRWEALDNEVARLETEVKVSRDRIAVISRGMMIDALRTGVQVGLPYNSPSSLALDSQLQFACKDLRESDFHYVLVSATVLGPSLEYLMDCGGFSRSTEFSEGVTFRRNSL